jgi:serine/threonine protein kinase
MPLGGKGGVDELKPLYIKEEKIAKHYEMDEKTELGKGAYAVVVPAIHRSTKAQVAIKTILKRYLVEEKEQKKVRREVELHQRLKHEHVVPLHEIYETHDYLYLVMEMCSAGNLRQLLTKRRTLPPVVAGKLAQQLLRGLVHMHQKGVLHCDIKPENVLLSERDTSWTSPEPGARARAQSPKKAASATAQKGDTHGASPPKEKQPAKETAYLVKLCDFGLSRKVPDVRFFKHTGDVHQVYCHDYPPDLPATVHCADLARSYRLTNLCTTPSPFSSHPLLNDSLLPMVTRFPSRAWRGLLDTSHRKCLNGSRMASLWTYGLWASCSMKCSSATRPSTLPRPASKRSLCFTGRCVLGCIPGAAITSWCCYCQAHSPILFEGVG